MMKKVITMIKNKHRSGSFSGEIKWCINVHIRKAKQLILPEDSVKPRLVVKLRVETDPDLIESPEHQKFLSETSLRPKYTHKTFNPEEPDCPFWDTHIEFHCFDPKTLVVEIIRLPDENQRIASVLVAQTRIELDDYRGKALKNLWIPLESKLLQKQQPSNEDSSQAAIQLCLGMAPKSCNNMNYVTIHQDKMRAQSEPLPPLKLDSLEDTLKLEEPKHNSVHETEMDIGDEILASIPIEIASEQKLMDSPNTRRRVTS